MFASKLFYFHNPLDMIKTKIKKAIAVLAIFAISTTSFGDVFAILDIGDGTIDGTVNTDILWDETFPGTASGSVTWIIVTARVLPTISMEISTWTIALGTLTAWSPASGNLDIEVGTNAANGVNITARSGSGGLTNISDNSIQINNLSDDWIQENYTFASTAWADDSSYTMISDGDLGAIEVINNTTEHIIYNTDKPERTENEDDVNFVVTATSTAETAAGDYQDNITFTITGNF